MWYFLQDEDEDDDGDQRESNQTKVFFTQRHNIKYKYNICKMEWKDVCIFNFYMVFKTLTFYMPGAMLCHCVVVNGMLIIPPISFSSSYSSLTAQVRREYACNAIAWKKHVCLSLILFLVLLAVVKEVAW